MTTPLTEAIHLSACGLDQLREVASADGTTPQAYLEALMHFAISQWARPGSWEAQGLTTRATPPAVAPIAGFEFRTFRESTAWKLKMHSRARMGRCSALASWQSCSTGRPKGCALAFVRTRTDPVASTRP